MKNEQNYNSVDLARVVFAIFVVAIHTNLASNLPKPFDWYIMQTIFRLAVPFFITVSSFMLGVRVRNKGLEASLKNIEINYYQYTYLGGRDGITLCKVVKLLS